MQAGPVAAATTGGVLTGHELALNSYEDDAFEPSNDLRELAGAQLQSLFAVLGRVAPGSRGRGVRACVYARRADSLESPHIRLQRVACRRTGQDAGAGARGWPPPAPGSSAAPGAGGGAFSELDEVLTLQRPGWEPGGGEQQLDTEASLIQEEIVLLPSSNLLVLPLAEAGVLLGLLVVEVVDALPPGSARGAQQQAQQHAQQPWELPPALCLSEDVLWALRMAVPPLAKACAMDLRQRLAGAQLEARQRLARSLLAEARGPLRALGTFGQLLAPRLTAEPDQYDMADGVLVQSARLADVVAQLESALLPRSTPPAGSAAAAASRQRLHAQLALPAAVPGDAGAASDDDEPAAWREGGSQWAVSLQGPARLQPALPQHCSAAQAGRPLPATQQQPQLPQLPTVLLPGDRRQAESLTSSSRDIRWASPSVRPSSASSASASSGSASSGSASGSSASSGSASSGSASGSSGSSGSASSGSASSGSSGSSPASSGSSGSSATASSYYCHAAAVGAEFDASKTIELEPLSTLDAAGATNSSSSGSSSSGGGGGSSGDGSSGGGSAAFVPRHEAGSGSSSAAGARRRAAALQQAPQHTPPGVCCNLVEVLSSLLSAAASLAQVQGVNLVCNQLQPEPAPPPATAATGGAALLPRPLRPLLVGVAAGVCRRVLSACLDIALQCTPRGGQLCVTAREATQGGVEVCLLHSGCAQLQRLHTSSRQLDQAGPWQRSAPGSHAGASPGAGGGGGASSSSSWSRGMQELSGGGLRGGARLITLEYAAELLQSLGGRLSVVYPLDFVNARSGELESGSNVVIFLPPPSAAS